MRLATQHEGGFWIWMSPCRRIHRSRDERAAWGAWISDRESRYQRHWM